MTKADLVSSICDEVGGFTKKEAAVITDIVFDTMKDALSEGEHLKLSGFGTFSVKHKKPRIGRNPRSGEEMMISERRVLSFKPSQILKRAVNNNG
ncbi:MAG: integration host factor subunit alpha [Pseudomonadota bacterium]